MLLAFIFKYKLNIERYYLPSMVILAIYLSFKNGFIRPDSIHMTGAYIILPLLGMVPVIVAPDEWLKAGYKILHIIVLFFCFLFWKGPDNIFGSNMKELVRTNYLGELLKSSRELSTYNLQLPNQDKIERIKSIISNKTIDIFPHMVIYAYAAGLNYSPRPIPQSYQPYDVYLDSINSLKISGRKFAPPDYLLFANSAIDNRYPFADESITKRAILEYYQPVDTFSLTSFVTEGDLDLAILLKRRAIPVKMKLVSNSGGDVLMNDWITTDTSEKLQYLYADVDFSLNGKIRRFLFQSPRLRMAVKFEDGTEKEFSAIIPILKTGILINKRLMDTKDAYTFFSTNGNTNKKITALKFYADDQDMFKPIIRVTLKSYIVESK